MNMKVFDEASQAFQAEDYIKALTILNGLLDEAHSAEPYDLLGRTLEKIGLSAEAADAFETAARFESTDRLTFLRRAARLHDSLGNDDRATSIALKLFKQDSSDAEAAYILALSFLRAGESKVAEPIKFSLMKSEKPSHLELAQRLIAEDPLHPEHLSFYQKIRDLKPADQNIRFRLLDIARTFCRFDIAEREEALLKIEMERNGEGILAWEAPHSNLMWCGDERYNRAADNVSDVSPISPQQSIKRRALPHKWSKRIRVGYLSSDFWDRHATMKLLQRVIELHDPAEFDISLYCYTPANLIEHDTGGRSRWGEIRPLHGLSDSEAADKIREFGVDILVDLKGHTSASRSAILNYMPAPIQVSWLGFPGSVVHIDSDYVIGDSIVLPDSSKPFFHEKFCRLPHSYQPNDSFYRPVPRSTNRAAWGLPDNSFVFAAFNATKKITPQTFDLWCRILLMVENGVLWLMCDSELAKSNILARARRAGVDSGRIIFAPKIEYQLHIDRLSVADLGLDTFPYNGHTTTSDKLWAGLPVITIKGSNFASRVSESLLHAAGLPSLVAANHEEYCRMAVSLSKDGIHLNSLKKYLANHRQTLLLFDSKRFCRNLENGYRMMIEKAVSGEAPEHFDVVDTVN